MMYQRSLFGNISSSILPHDGDVVFYPHFFSAKESDLYFATLLEDINWKQEPIQIFGKQVLQPRLTAWYGDSNKTYSYSGITMQPQAWINPLTAIKQKIEIITGVQFTSALLNRYRNGQDSMGWHRDNEKELGNQPVIASASFGNDRIFQFRNYNNKTEKTALVLTHGSLLVMRGQTNTYWEHQVPKTKQTAGERINLTFRILS
jgi:alkylated DNA repair dioxygenase AlkB